MAQTSDCTDQWENVKQCETSNISITILQTSPLRIIIYYRLCCTWQVSAKSLLDIAICVVMKGGLPSWVIRKAIIKKSLRHWPNLVGHAKHHLLKLEVKDF